MGRARLISPLLSSSSFSRRKERVEAIFLDEKTSEEKRVSRKKGKKGEFVPLKGGLYLVVS